MEEEEQTCFEHFQLKFNNVIAEGCFGTLMMVYSSKTQVNYSLRRIHESRFIPKDLGFLENLSDIKEMELYIYYRHLDYVYMLMDYCPNDIYQTLKKQPSLNDEQLMKYCRELLSTIKQFHDQNIAQNDIKPTNFVFDKYGRVRISNFGAGPSFDDSAPPQSYTSTMLFMAPEVFRKRSYDPLKADIWSLGVTFYCMATKGYPYFANNLNAFIKLLNAGIYPVYTVENEHLRDIIVKCLDFNPNVRPTVDQLLSMPYFESITPAPAQKRMSFIKSSKSATEFHSPLLNKISMDSSTRISQVPFRRRMFNAMSMRSDKRAVSTSPVPVIK